MAIMRWWQDAICYQIYPRSFADDNGDGIGDLSGVMQKLDYLQWLGINAIWFSPFFPSPQFDCGYDISDYTDIAPEYGTLQDFERLLTEAHRCGMRVILDLVLNHTSDQHPWFLQSKSSRENAYRDWYIWRDGVNGGPPNDWESIFGGSAWDYHEATGQYYYHFFFPPQPDLNWRNPAVVDALFAAVRFWLDKGVDGFRLDAIGTIFEDENLPNSGVAIAMEDIFLDWTAGGAHAALDVFVEKVRYQVDLPETHTAMQALRRLVDEYPECLLLGETEDVRFYGNGHDELHTVFNFDLLNRARFDAAAIRQVLFERLSRLPAGAWESNTVSNHDRSRAVSFYGDGKDDEARARVALAMAMFLRGTPVFYNGEEIAMRDYPLQDITLFRDNLGVWIYHALQRKLGLSPAEALRLANIHGRDKCRTPMQWQNAPNAGFSPAGVQSWLPVNPDYAQGVNVADQRDDPDSMLNYFRQLAQIRHDHAVLRYGEMELLDTGDVLAFWRRLAQQECLVALNMSAEPTRLAIAPGKVQTVYSSHPQAEHLDLSALSLAPHAVYVGAKVAD